MRSAAVRKRARPPIGPFIVALLAIAVSGGCRQPNSAEPALTFKLDLRPSPPTVGMATATVELTEPDGKPVRNAVVKLEGNMNHAGMVPVFADAKEKAPGKYEAELEFTMGGDWFVLIRARLSDGRKVQHKVDVPGVKSR